MTGMATNWGWSTSNNSRTSAGAVTLPPTRLFNSFQMYSIGYKSGDVEGQGIVCMLMLARNCVVWRSPWLCPCRVVIQRYTKFDTRSKTEKKRFYFLTLEFVCVCVSLSVYAQASVCVRLRLCVCVYVCVYV